MPSVRMTRRPRGWALRGFIHPQYPPPYDDYPRCCYIVCQDYYRHLPRSVIFPELEVSPDGDPYSAVNLGLAEKAIAHYRAAVEWPRWSNRIARYPVPEWMHRKSSAVCGAPYPEVETECGMLIEHHLGTVLELLELRAFVLACLRAGDDPSGLVRAIARQGVQDARRYLAAVARRKGERPPRAPRGQTPLTEIVRPDLSGAVPDWRPERPDFDAAFAAGDGLAEALGQVGIDPPSASAAEWLGMVRAGIDPRRAKIKADKLSRWKR